MQHTSIFAMVIYNTVLHAVFANHNFSHFLTRSLCGCILFMKQQFVVTHTLRPTEIPTITMQFSYKHTFCQNVVPTAKLLSLLFPENVTCLSVCMPRNGPVFSVSCKIEYQWVTTNCCFVSDMIHCDRSQKMPVIVAPASHNSRDTPERPHA